MYVYCFYGCKVIVQILNYNFKMAYPIDIITIIRRGGGVEGVDPLPLDDLRGWVQSNKSTAILNLKRTRKNKRILHRDSI